MIKRKHFKCLKYIDYIPDIIMFQKDKLLKRKDTLMDLLLDGIITKDDYASKTETIKEQLSILDRKEAEMGKEVPLLCSHIEQIKVYENRLDIYLDFLFCFFDKACLKSNLLIVKQCRK